MPKKKEFKVKKFLLDKKNLWYIMIDNINLRFFVRNKKKKGNPVKNRNGPAAVTGRRKPQKCHYAENSAWEGAASRMNRESEDLPEIVVKCR